jgi:hypothetical protein
MAIPTEVKDALKNIADKVAKYVEDAADMTVETRFIEIGGNTEDSKLAARSLVKLDGDSQSVLPMKRAADGTLTPDTLTYELHQQNVQATIDYRTKMLERLLGMLRGS